MHDLVLRCLEAKDISLLGKVIFPWTTFAETVEKWERYLKEQKEKKKLALKDGFGEVGIGVGLYQDYGAAQRLYFRLGYSPDGRGITYKCKSVTPGESYPVDDLILWLRKKLT